MNLTKDQRSLMERIINTAETGKAEGNYAAISIYADGPHDIKQITYGRSQTTEYGNLRKLVKMYVAANGTLSAALALYAEKVGSVPLTDNADFKNLLRSAGKNDPVMRIIQDQFFEETYFSPAIKWADVNGFTKALSALVVYDSYIHSGSILWVIRQKFDENTPAFGGDEKKWISEYTKARNDWLLNHQRPAVQASAYRTKAYLSQIEKENWDLSIFPINMNGTNVTPAGNG
ncbi:MAG: chitosanase [Leptothrix ochracea]|uniref:chitosanase n=1 Tax=Leptothrix ochracea TaxID=735331 RepID=UPI0034E1F9A2